MATRKKKTHAKTGRKTKTAQKKKNYYSIYIITLCIVTLLLSIFMYIDTGEGGIINSAVKFVVCGIFGIVGYLLPVALLGIIIYFAKVRDIKKLWIKLILVIMAIINVGALVNLSQGFYASDAFYEGAYNGIGGGFLGACVSVFMEAMLQKIASYILLSVTLILLASAIANVSIFSYIGRFLFKGASKAKDKYTDMKEQYDERRQMEQKYAEEYANEPSSIDNVIEAMDVFESEKKSTAKRKKKEKKPEVEKSFENEIEEMFSDGIDEVFGTDIKEETADTEIFKEEKAEPQKKATKREEKERAEKISSEEKLEFSKELDAAIEKPVAEYKYPSVDLLDKPKNTKGDHVAELRGTAQKLINILGDFGVKAKLLGATKGPTVTRYEIQPDTGVKLSKIVGLAEDLALNLAVSNVRVAPVPGKAAVGVEIPNNKVTPVSVREMLETDEFRNGKSKLTIALGKDIGGNVVLGDIAKWPHVLIAGATGSGKSVCVNTIITSILYKASPEDVKLIMVDPKVVELGVYNGIPHLLIPVVTEPKKAAGALNWAVAEMMRRYELFKETGVRKLESYNKLMEAQGGEKVPQLVIIIDELADLMMVAAKEVEDYICRLAQLARAAGIHLIIATQRPSVDVITGLIKANIPSRIAFAVSSQVDSRTILDKGGAEKLLGMGDMLYYPMGARAAIRVQGAFVSDAEIEKILGFIKENAGETHYSEDLAEQIERCATGENGVTPDTEEDGDELLPDAIQLAIELGKISTSMVQRRLSVGYSRAGRIIDQMEARGIISGANGSKPRDVLVSHADFAGVDEEETDYEDEE